MESEEKYKKMIEDEVNMRSNTEEASDFNSQSAAP